MISLVAEKQTELEKLCIRYRVKSLELFGSGTNDDFNLASSDLDFLVLFQPCSPSEHYDRYFGLLESLEKLFGRRVDLVEADAMRNQYFIRRVNESRKPIYAA